ncbi:hypothetical protein [Streptomyces lydicus]|uniref:hypothetical protein n=1 Tax=Streptomyces lydicus TaxID=47763 RepID=UPI0037B94BCB
MPRTHGLDLRQHIRVAEYGTGSGCSGGRISPLVGPDGEVPSLGIDHYLTRWAHVIHHERGLENIRCRTADGTEGFREGARTTGGRPSGAGPAVSAGRVTPTHGQ